MLKLFQKKKDYGQFSQKFRTHLTTRQQKVNKIFADDIKVQEKIKILKSLISDKKEKQNHRNQAFIQEFISQKSKINVNKMQEKYLNQLMAMSQGFSQWAQSNDDKNKRDNQSNLDPLKKQKRRKKLAQTKYFRQLLIGQMKLKQIRQTHRLKKDCQKMLHKVQNNVIYNNKEKPLYLALRKKSNQQNFIQTCYNARNRQKFKLSKYFQEMKQFNNRNQTTKSLKNSPLNSRCRLPQKFSRSALISIQQSNLNEKLNESSREQILKQILEDKGLKTKLQNIQSFQQTNHIITNRLQSLSESLKIDQFSEDLLFKDKALTTKPFKNCQQNRNIRKQLNLKSQAKSKKQYQQNQQKLNAIKRLRCF